MKKLKGINLAILLLATMLIFVLGFGYTQVKSDKIPKNTYVKYVNIGGLNKEEAKEKILSEYKMDTIVLGYEDRHWSISPKDVGLNYDIEKTIDRAYYINRKSNIFKNIIDTLKSSAGVVNTINVVVDYDDEKIIQELEEIAKDVNIDMENAKLGIKGSAVDVQKEKIGLEVDTNQTLTNIKKALQTGIFEESLVVTKIEPNLKEEDLKEIDTLLGSYKTTLYDVSPGRVHNIKLASERTSDILIMPGEEFSYNDKTKLRSVKNGYQNASVIMQGEIVEGTGGGVCQVSTTIYNAVMYAGLDIVEISNHSIPSSYAQKGRDAVVTDTGLDFVFKNNYNKPVYIRNYYSNGVLTSQIYGASEYKQNIEILTTTDKVGEMMTKTVKDSTMEDGKKKTIEKGRKSYTVSTYRVYYDEKGKEIKREKIATSYYPPKQEIIAIGTKKKQEIEKPETENPKEPEEDNDENDKDESIDKEEDKEPEEEKPSVPQEETDMQDDNKDDVDETEDLV